MKNNIIAALGGLAIISVASILSLSSAFATNTNTSQDNVTVSVPVSCTMNGTGMTSHNANIPNGTYQADIGTTTLKTFCNDNQGFAIYAIGYTNEEYGNTTLIGATGGQTIVTGTATTTGNPDVSNWAVKLATDSTATYPITLDNSFGAYSSVPSTYTKVAHRDSGTDLGSSATGASLTTTYAAYISKTQQADTYNGKVKYTLVHPANADPGQQEIECDGGKICYSPNTSTSIGEMGKQSASNNTSVTLWAPNFKRQGYGFAGWNTSYDYSGVNYGPSQDIITPSDIEANGLSLYAVWVPSNGILQNWNGCDAMNVGDVTALTDNRDNDTYAVAKLADNKCWMIENLRLDNIPELSPTNTHNPSLPIVNIYDDTNPVTSNHLSAPVNPIQTAWGYPDDQSMLATNNTTLFINNNSLNYDISNDVYNYGNNYNWYSAVAGYRFYYTTTSNNSPATSDICPAGWHLMAYGDMTRLNIAVNPYIYGSEASNRLRSYPVNYIYPGYVVNDHYYNRSTSDFYWYSSFRINEIAEGFWLNGSGVHVDGYLNMAYGASVRCVGGV